MSLRTPSYRRHKPTGQAVVSIDGRDFYLGKFGTAASRAEYDRRIAEWLANGRRLVKESRGDLTVTELVVAYVQHAEAYYVKNGVSTKETPNIKLALKPLRRLYGHTPARDFGPLALKAVREAHVVADICRNECNKRTRHVVRMFRWVVENELVPPSVHHGLKVVTGLRRGRSEARETAPVKPVPEAFVEAVRPHVARQAWAVIELQRLTGARPGEILQMRTRDLDTSGRVWVYTPLHHKTEHHGKTREIYLGPKAQEMVRPWLRRELEAPLFQPRESIAEYRLGIRRERKTKVQPSQKTRRKKRRLRKEPGEQYTTESYGQAIANACKRAFPHPTLAGVRVNDLTAEQRAELRDWHRRHKWHPHQLRHNSVTTPPPGSARNSDSTSPGTPSTAPARPGSPSTAVVAGHRNPARWAGRSCL